MSAEYKQIFPDSCQADSKEQKIPYLLSVQNSFIKANSDTTQSR